MKDYYQILGIGREATQEDIRRAFRSLSLVWHPDRHVGESPERIAIAEECFKEINEAYGVLSDTAKKASYDWFYAHSGMSSCPPPAGSTGSSQGAGASPNGGTDSSFSRRYWGSGFGDQSGNTPRRQRTQENRQEIFSSLFGIVLVLFMNVYLAPNPLKDLVREIIEPSTYTMSAPPVTVYKSFGEKPSGQSITDILGKAWDISELRVMDIPLDFERDSLRNSWNSSHDLED